MFFELCVEWERDQHQQTTLLLKNNYTDIFYLS